MSLLLPPGKFSFVFRPMHFHPLFFGQAKTFLLGKMFVAPFWLEKYWTLFSPGWENRTDIFSQQLCQCFWYIAPSHVARSCSFIHSSCQVWNYSWCFSSSSVNPTRHGSVGSAILPWYFVCEFGRFLIFQGLGWNRGSSEQRFIFGRSETKNSEPNEKRRKEKRRKKPRCLWWGSWACCAISPISCWNFVDVIFAFPHR